MLLTVLISLLVISVGLFIFAIYKDDTKERITRESFLVWIIFVVVGHLILSKNFESHQITWGDAVPSIFLLATAYPLGRAYSRRCRDTGWSKKPAYYSVIPIVGIFTTIGLLFARSTTKQYDVSNFRKVER